jgi:signal transduction histidine kinase
MSRIKTSHAPIGPATNVSAEPLRIVIVDDSEADLVSLSRLLRRTFGPATQIRQAEDGAAALDILGREAIDVALVDYLLPDMDGMVLLTAIRQANPRTATILLTGQGNEMVAAEAIKSGAREYLLKRDLDAVTLSRTVTQALAAARHDEKRTEMVQELERSHAEMDHFVRALSHDMGAHFLLLEHSLHELQESCEEAPRPRMTEAVAHIEACLRESRRYVDDLRALSQTGSVQMEPSCVSLADVIHEVCYEQDELIGARGVEILVEPGLPQVWCNETRVKQILTNLVRNALKHGCDATRPRITISAVAPPLDARVVGHAWIRVHDNGAGIPAKSREEIFMPGARLPTASSDGTGMGLAIVHKIVDRYGGRVFVDPACIQGTAFVFSLPQWKGQRPEVRRQDAGHKRHEPAPKRPRGLYGPAAYRRS